MSRHKRYSSINEMMMHEGIRNDDVSPNTIIIPVNNIPNMANTVRKPQFIDIKNDPLRNCLQN